MIHIRILQNIFSHLFPNVINIITMCHYYENFISGLKQILNIVLYEHTDILIIISFCACMVSKRMLLHNKAKYIILCII